MATPIHDPPGSGGEPETRPTGKEAAALDKLVQRHLGAGSLEDKAQRLEQLLAQADAPAAQYEQWLLAGARVYQYTNGFMHSKVLMIDDVWSSVGSANFDYRSLHLNFELTCLIESKVVQGELEQAFLRDLGASIRLDPDVFTRRPFVAKMAENACRLLSPVL